MLKPLKMRLENLVMGRSKLEEALVETLADGNKIFVPYIMAGDGGLEQLHERILFLERSGATALEIGVPFSDPVADGPAIQEAGLRALEEEVTLAEILDTLKKDRSKRTIPIILMTYLNPIIAYGVKKFTEKCEGAGVDGLIVPDMPIEEEGLLTHHLKEAEVALIRLAALTSPIERLETIAEKTEGFLYAVTVTGITGVRKEFTENVGEYIKRLKSLSSVPVLAGFGVSTPEHVKELSKYGDGVIVGSQIVSSFYEERREDIASLIQAAKIE